jgi:hypothetical protein
MRRPWLALSMLVACNVAPPPEVAPTLLAEIEFMFPQQIAEVKHSLARTEYAKKRAAELGLLIDQALVDNALEGMVSQIQELSSVSLEEWAGDEHSMSWSEVRKIYRRHLYDNLLFRSVYVADMQQIPNLQMMVLANPDADVVNSWAEALELGQHPQGLGANSEIVGQWRTDAYVEGSIIGPLRLINGMWMLGRVMSVAEADGIRDFATIQQIATNCDISPFAAEVWIREMASRYTID